MWLSSSLRHYTRPVFKYAFPCNCFEEIILCCEERFLILTTPKVLPPPKHPSSSSSTWRFGPLSCPASQTYPPNRLTPNLFAHPLSAPNRSIPKPKLDTTDVNRSSVTRFARCFFLCCTILAVDCYCYKNRGLYTIELEIWVVAFYKWDFFWRFSEKLTNTNAKCDQYLFK